MDTWAVHSSTDPRWNNSGESETPLVAAYKWVEKCRKQYGEPPEDTVMERVT